MFFNKKKKNNTTFEQGTTNYYLKNMTTYIGKAVAANEAGDVDSANMYISIAKNYRTMFESLVEVQKECFGA